MQNYDHKQSLPFYDHKMVEKKWQAAWEKTGIYTPDLEKAVKRDKFYNLFMFPYPSAEGLHVGHAFSSIGSDIYGRFTRMNGKTVFQPMGYDSFGIHSENYAIKIGENPHEVVKRTTKNYEGQLKSLGNGYDWTRTVTTSDPDYYRWTQWLFIEMFKAGLAYRKKAEVNFCPSCKTVLADEQVMTPKQAGKEARDASGELLAESDELRVCERCGTVTEKRDLDQWFFKITDYADRLLSGLDTIDWSPRVVTAQREWIGKKSGRLMKFDEVEVFTTRPETINSATFIAISGSEDKFTGKYVTNPINNKKIPVWTAEYVLSGYGTGAVMGVPAYDERDMAFAKKHDLEVTELPFEENKLGVKKTNYHLRDWLVSRQRYWGPPIPMIYCEKCSLKGIGYQGQTLKGKFIEGLTLQENMAGWYPDENLPILLPEIKDYKPEGNGRGPLANHPEFYKVKCPKCGSIAKRETDVMDTFVDSSWYFLRYPSVGSDTSSTLLRGPHKVAASREAAGITRLPWNNDINKVWLPVDLYFGGAEHSVLHLMYARFVNMVMYDRGYIDHAEPFPKFFAHGLMIKDGAKMSKSRGNVVNPDAYVEKYGADTLRMYVMFLGSMDGYPDFRDSGIEGMSRFLKRVWNLFLKGSNTSHSNMAIQSKLHQTIKKVTEDIKLFKYNTSIAAIMELVNVLSSSQQPIAKDCLVALVKLLAPFAPHLTEELWQVNLSQTGSIHLSTWPKYDEKYLKSGKMTIAVQVNGKLRGTIEVDSDLTKTEIIKLAKEDEKVSKWLVDGKLKKQVFIPNKLVNFVV